MANLPITGLPPVPGLPTSNGQFAFEQGGVTYRVSLQNLAAAIVGSGPAPVLGGVDTDSTLTGDGTNAAPLSVTLPLPNNPVAGSYLAVDAAGNLFWSGFNAPSGGGSAPADDWGAQVVQSDGTLGGDGTSGNPLTVANPLPQAGSAGEVLTTDAAGNIVWAAPAAGTTYSNGLGILIDSSNKIHHGHGIRGHRGDVVQGANSMDLTVTAIQGNPVAAGTPNVGDVLKWDGAKFKPTPDLAGSGGDDWGSQVVKHDGATLSGDGTSTNPLMVANPLPQAGSSGEVLTTDASGNIVWAAPATAPGYSGGLGIGIGSGNTIYHKSGTKGHYGDVSQGSNSMALTVRKLQGTPVAATVPQAGEVLTFDGTQWEPQPAGTGADNWGSQVVATDGTLQGDGTAGNPLTVVNPATNYSFGLGLQDLGGSVVHQSGLGGHSGDVVQPFNSMSLTVKAIQGQAVATTAPGTGDFLRWNGSAWEAANPPTGADDWGSQVVATDGTLQGDGTAGNPLSVAQGFIPLSGTVAGSPVTGDIEFMGDRIIKSETSAFIGSIQVYPYQTALSVFNSVSNSTAFCVANTSNSTNESQVALYSYNGSDLNEVICESERLYMGSTKKIECNAPEITLGKSGGEVTIVGANHSNAKLAFFGTTPVPQQTLPAAPTALDIKNLLQAYGLCA